MKVISNFLFVYTLLYAYDNDKLNATFCTYTYIISCYYPFLPSVADSMKVNRFEKNGTPKYVIFMYTMIDYLPTKYFLEQRILCVIKPFK